MFKINHNQDQSKAIDYLELKNSDASCYAKIDLKLGGSLQELKLMDKTIISDKNMPPYHQAFMSSILFPFANRIENGNYNFNDKNFVLDRNEINNPNAIHGLVYDKAFKLIDQGTSENFASVTLSYDETQPISGFPFKYCITLQYVLTTNALELNIEIKNNDTHVFPYSLGWHPYFNTKDLYNSHLKMDSHKKILVNDQMIPNGEADIIWDRFLKIENKTFDDCFVLNTNKIEFKTPEFHFEFEFSPKNNYLQIYTPNDRKSIAIEPQTAPANCFNTKMGLQILQPNKTHNLTWKINLK